MTDNTFCNHLYGVSDHIKKQIEDKEKFENKLWLAWGLYIDANRDNMTIEDARLMYYFIDQVITYGYNSARIRVLLDCYMYFNRSAWEHVQRLNSQGVFINV